MCGIFAIIGSGEAQSLSYEKGKARGPEQSVFKTVSFGVHFGFHRLAINGFANELSSQPIKIDDCTVICNGEIYNWTTLHEQIRVPNITGSDCEIIIHMYKRFGIEEMLLQLDGVFAFALHDSTRAKTFIARDPYGIRPLFQGCVKSSDVYASELKMLCLSDTLVSNISQFPPGYFKCVEDNKWTRYFYPSFSKCNGSYEDAKALVRCALVSAVRKRVQNTDREIGCLLSGGLDSSLISALVSGEKKARIHTWSIGMPNSPDLFHASIVSKHLNSYHHCIELQKEDFISALPEVIRTIESYDVTTVRASVGNWLIGKYIKQMTEQKVIFNGDGADEVCGGYLYLKNAPSDIDFEKDCRRLLNEIHFFDVLRCDRSISSHGLEPRTPFLDKSFVQTYFSIPIVYRRSSDKLEKKLLRDAFEGMLPDSVLYRRKEAFSDGVSSNEDSWFSILQTHIKNTYEMTEAEYYKTIFEETYKNQSHVIPHLWMPKFVDATDPSARTLEVYNN